MRKWNTSFIIDFFPLVDFHILFARISCPLPSPFPLSPSPFPLPPSFFPLVSSPFYFWARNVVNYSWYCFGWWSVKIWKNFAHSIANTRIPLSQLELAFSFLIPSKWRPILIHFSVHLYLLSFLLSFSQFRVSSLHVSHGFFNIQQARRRGQHLQLIWLPAIQSNK